MKLREMRLVRRMRHFHRKRAGVATVEMAIVAPLMIMLLFGILELGLMIKDYLGLAQAAREGARVAAVGSSTTTIDARIDASAPTIDTAQLTWTGAYRVYHESTGTWDATWTTLANVGSGADLRNNAPTGAQVRISVLYPHQLVAGRLFEFLSDDGNPGVVTLWSNMVMRRE